MNEHTVFVLGMDVNLVCNLRRILTGDLEICSGHTNHSVLCTLDCRTWQSCSERCLVRKEKKNTEKNDKRAPKTYRNANINHDIFPNQQTP